MQRRLCIEIHIRRLSPLQEVYARQLLKDEGFSVVSCSNQALSLDMHRDDVMIKVLEDDSDYPVGLLKARIFGPNWNEVIKRTWSE